VSNVLIGIIGVILFIGLALSGASYFGSNLVATKVDAQASDYLNQSSQIGRAIEQYASDNGRLPIDGSRNPIDILIESKYMRSAPPGGSSTWTYVDSAKAMLASVSGTSTQALQVCVSARKRASMPSPTNVLKCDGSTGALSKKDPCCLR
jgi:hypothetical protein